MSRSFQTPTSALPLRRKQTQPNIFFSSTFLRRARASRMRAARDSSKAIRHSDHIGGTKLTRNPFRSRTYPTVWPHGFCFGSATVTAPAFTATANAA